MFQVHRPSGRADVAVGDDGLSELAYDALRQIAGRHIAREGPQPLRDTELVHEAFLRLSCSESMITDGSHFFRLMSRIMRQVLVDQARRRLAEKRGGGEVPVALDAEMLSDEGPSLELIDLHDALRRLGRMDARLERLVELRFFTGLTLDETAAALGVSRRKACNDWAVARLWLRRALAPS
jgi:RNA polymerase sigma-70 factor, ECF subfamily